MRKCPTCNTLNEFNDNWCRKCDEYLGTQPDVPSPGGLDCIALLDPANVGGASNTVCLPRPYYGHAGITIYHGDCRQIIPMLGRFDLLLTDPPYGIGDKWTNGVMDGKRGTSKLWGKGEKWDDETPSPWLLAQCIEAANRSIIWGGNYFGLPATRGWLSWDKMQKYSGSDCELAWTNLEIPTRVFRMSRIDAHQNKAEYVKEHPTEKPMQLLRWCIGLAGEVKTIIDPFAGSGTTGRAAKDLGLKCVLIEREERYCEIAARRLEQEVLPLGDRTQGSNEPRSAHGEPATNLNK